MPSAAWQFAVSSRKGPPSEEIMEHSPSGMSPSTLVPCTKNFSKLFNCSNSTGIVPVRPVRCKSSSTRLLMLVPKKVGISPVICMFRARFSVFRLVAWANHWGGIVPEKLFPEISRFSVSFRKNMYRISP